MVRWDQPPVVRVERDPHAETHIASDEWPRTVPAVEQLYRDGLDLPAGVTFLVGENGSGKSTIVEAVAMLFGLAPEGGSGEGGRRTRESESALPAVLRIRRGLGTGRWGFFLRAETMHSWYTYQEENKGAWDPLFHEMSHGESFLAVLDRRFDSPGLYCLDEPEAALSFSSTLRLMDRLDRLARSGGQVLCATHSPVLASLPGVRLIEVGPWGLRESTWEDLELVRHWRTYLDAPERYLRHLLGHDDD